MAAVLSDGDRTERLGAVACPTLVIHGRVDPLVTLSGGEATAKAIPGAELLVIDDMGHDMPPAIVPHVVEAIAKLAARAMKFGIFYEHQLPRRGRRTASTGCSTSRSTRSSWPTGSASTTRGRSSTTSSRSTATRRRPRCSWPPPASARSGSGSGHGIIQLTTNHPARVAERVSTLDLVSHGRVELGIGEGTTTTELHPFGRRFRDKREVWEDAVRALIPMFGEERVEYHGEYFDFPLRNVLPKPLQKPHPPLWVACSQLDTIETAGRWGMGALGFQFVSADEAHAWVAAYYNAFTKRLEQLADYATNPNIAVVSGFMCCPTDEEANVKADGWTFFAFALRFYTTHVPGDPGETVNLWEEYQAFRPHAAVREDARRRADRLARDDPRQAAQVRGDRTSTR